MKDVNELLEIAKKCEQYEEYDLALKYYRTVLEAAPNLQVAEVGVDRVRSELAKCVYYVTPASYKLSEGRLELRKGSIIFISTTSAEAEYMIDDIDNMRVALGRFVFDYKGKPQDGYSCRNARKLIELIKDAKEGKYPKLSSEKSTSLEKYIQDNFTPEQKEEAIMYFKDMSGCLSDEARTTVARILG